MDLFNWKTKNSEDESVSTTEKVTENSNDSPSNLSDSQSRIVSKNISFEIAASVQKVLEDENIPFEMNENGNAILLRIYEEDAQEVDEIIDDCEDEYVAQLRSKEPKTGLDNQINTAESRPPEQKKEQKVYQMEIVPGLKDELDKLLRQHKIQPYQFRNENNKLLIIFYEKDRKSISAVYQNLLKKVASTDSTEEKTKPQKKKTSKKILGRTEQVKVRFTPDEMKILQDRIQSSGKKQGDFIREMLLEGYVKAFPSHANDLTIIQELQSLNAQVGKLTGAMVKIMQLEKENHNLSEEEKANLQKAINGMKSLRTEIRKGVKPWL